MPLQDDEGAVVAVLLYLLLRQGNGLAPLAAYRLRARGTMMESRLACAEATKRVRSGT